MLLIDEDDGKQLDSPDIIHANGLQLQTSDIVPMGSISFSFAYFTVRNAEPNVVFNFFLK
jgi:hypothetical protein